MTPRVGFDTSYTLAILTTLVTDFSQHVPILFARPRCLPILCVLLSPFGRKRRLTLFFGIARSHSPLSLGNSAREFSRSVKCAHLVEYRGFSPTSLNLDTQFVKLQVHFLRYSDVTHVQKSLSSPFHTVVTPHLRLRDVFTCKELVHGDYEQRGQGTHMSEGLWFGTKTWREGLRERQPVGDGTWWGTCWRIGLDTNPVRAVGRARVDPFVEWF